MDKDPMPSTSTAILLRGTEITDLVAQLRDSTEE